MKAIVFGAGKIARGFVGQLLADSKFEITFVEIDPMLVKMLKDYDRYTVHVLGDESLNTTVTNYKALSLDNINEIAKEMSESVIAFTAVGGKNLKNLGKVIADCLNISHIKDRDFNFVTCENWKNAGEELREAIESNLNIEEKKKFETYIGVNEGVVMRIATQPSKEQLESEPLGTWVQNFWELPVNKEYFKGELPPIKGIKLIDHFGCFLEQKLYTNNTSNAVIAYNGYLRGYRIVAEAANSPEISEMLDEVYKEINETLIRELHVEREQQELLAKKARDKYSDWQIVDQITRHAKDPIRKLGPDDRLIAPARMAIKNGVNPFVITNTIAAALYFDYPGDPIALELKAMRESKGIPYILKNICKLDENEQLYTKILNAVYGLKKAGLIK